MTKIPIELEVDWESIKTLKEIEEKHWNSHKIIKIIKMISERNIAIICKLWKFNKDHQGIDDIKTFIEKNW